MFPLAHKTLSKLNALCWALCQIFSGHFLLSSSHFCFSSSQGFSQNHLTFHKIKHRKKFNVSPILKQPEPFLWRVQVLHLILAHEHNWQHKRKKFFHGDGSCQKIQLSQLHLFHIKELHLPIFQGKYVVQLLCAQWQSLVSIWGWVHVSVPILKKSSQTAVRSDPSEALPQQAAGDQCEEVNL